MCTSVMFVLLCVLVLCPLYPGCLLDTATCGGSSALITATIPEGMPLDDFNSLIVNKTLGELYYVLPRPPAYPADINYLSNILPSATPGRYQVRELGESQGSVPACVRWNSTLDVRPGTNTATFIRNKDLPQYTELQVMWSSCPSNYIWSMRCSTGLNSKRCPLSDVSLGLFVHQTSIDDLLWTDMMQDLCPTGIKFGDADFKWSYTFGPNTLC